MSYCSVPPESNEHDRSEQYAQDDRDAAQGVARVLVLGALYDAVVVGATVAVVVVNVERRIGRTPIYVIDFGYTFQLVQ